MWGEGGSSLLVNKLSFIAELSGALSEWRQKREDRKEENSSR